MLEDVSQTRLPAVAASVSDARHVARDLAVGMPADIAERLELVVSELASNAVRHAQTSFMLSILTQPSLRVEVADGSAALPTPRQPGPWSEGGRGLWLVAACTECWGVTRRGSGKCVWADLGPID